MARRAKVISTKEIEIPQYPNQLKQAGIAALIFFIGGLIYPFFFAISAAFLVIAIGVIAYNPKFKAIYYCRRAILKYNSQKYNECLELCKKTLKYDSSLTSAHNLMSLSIKKRNKKL